MTAALNAPLEGIRIVEFEGIGPGPLAGRMLARHLWRTTLGNQRVNESELVPGSAWLWPRQARDLVADYTLAPLGFA